jgi:hypothetical protein
MIDGKKTFSGITSCKRFIGFILLSTTCTIPLANAQTGSGSSPLSSTPPSFQTVDSQGVNLATGNLNLSLPLINIGNGDSEIAWSYRVRGNITSDNQIPTLSNNLASIDASGTLYLKLNRNTISFSFDKYVNGTDSSAGTIYKPKYNKLGVLFKYTMPAMTRTFKRGSATSSFTSTVKYVYIDKFGAEYTFYYFQGLPNGNYVDNIKQPNGNIEKYYYDYLNGENAGHDISNIVISVDNSYGMHLKI